MGYTEAKVVWPDIRTSCTTTRPLTISTLGEVQRIDQISLTILVNGCLYLVRETMRGLRVGQILSRNLDMTVRKGGDKFDPADQVFVVYNSIYDARRGIGRVYGRYKAVEIPELLRWRMETDQLMRSSWSLHQASLEETTRFVWQADRRIRRHTSDKAEHKVSARERLCRLATLKDSLGRRNTTMIPPMCSAIDRSLELRTQEVRGKGRRMDWRAVVLEHVIDQLRNECCLIRRAAQDALTAKDIFGAERTPNSLRKRAGRMYDYADFLGEVHVRTFNRVFVHVAKELEEACDLLRKAAEERNPGPLERVRDLFRRIFRSMVLLDEHWRLEEILLIASDNHHRKQPFSEAQISMFLEELTDVHRSLTSPDKVTGEPLDKGFSTSILPDVTGNVMLCLLDIQDEKGVDLAAFYDHLKIACRPL